MRNFKNKFIKFLLSYGLIWGRDIGLHYGRLKEFKSDFSRFKSKYDAENNSRFLLEWKDRYPCLYDKSESTPYDRHYIYHPAWAARVLAKVKPKKHLDFSSTLTFSSVVSAFFPVEFYDFRPANLNLSNLESKAADLLKLPFLDGEVESASCMHVIEHIGLGRYGDAIDPNGDLTAISELRRIMALGGSLLIVVPVGVPRIQFNAHRIYSRQQVEDLFPDFYLEEFMLITDDENSVHTIENASESIVLEQKYGCGCFWFKKIKC